ncbi:MAG: DUF4062 domain-containing protein [Christensenellaceae bacterium]|nr:DUF4062 domain-containing protein [Christensenellaceae bacterium]
MNEKKYQIFISSTYMDLIEERNAAIKTILNLGHFPIGMEMFNAGDDSQWEVIKRTIDSSDYYVVIIGLRYGSTVDTGMSYTEMEYDYAISKRIPMLTFIKDESIASTPEQRESDVDKGQRLSAFREKAKKKVVRFWGTTDAFTTVLSTDLHNAFINTPRTGWIPAGFDPIAMIQEMGALSKENRELREKLNVYEIRRPQLDFSLESNEGSCFTYTWPKKLIRQELHAGDIADELIQDLIEYDRTAITNAELLSQFFSIGGPSQDEDCHDESVVVVDAGEIDYRKKFTDKIAAYNTSLPSQQAYDDYNKRNERYLNMTENKHAFWLKVKNNGTCMANHVTITLNFPSGLLVFDDYDIKQAQKPKDLNIPPNPLHDSLGSKTAMSLLEAVSRKQAAFYPLLPEISASLLNVQRDYYTDSEDYLCYEKEKLLHTQTTSSDDFYIVATRSGIFKIEGELICEELPEPIRKTFEIVVN